MLRAASQPHWASLALIGAGTCAYDWTIGDDRIAWLGDAGSVLGLDGEPPETATAYRELMRPGTDALRDFADGGPAEESFALSYEVRSRVGSYVSVEDCGLVMRNGEGAVERMVGLIRAKPAAGPGEERGGHLDRGQMRDALDAAIDWAMTENAKAALLMCAIDGLGAINDAYGLDIADEVLAETTRRLAAAMGADGTIGRVGGNKHAALMLGCDAAAMVEKADKLRDAVQASMIQTTGGPVAVTISLGALALPSGASNSAMALMRAEDALAQAKQAGRSNLVVFDASPEREAARRRKAAVGAGIIAALRADRFRIAYQPIVCARTGRIESYEALIRMLSEDGSPVPAGDFIPAAEELGLVRDLDRRVLELAASALKRAPALKLGVNLSGMSVGDEAWSQTFNNCLAGDRSVCSRLTVEVTETAALHDIDEGVRFVKQLRTAGCRVAIDDFGVGYTSFRNLQLLDLNCVKIDGVFVKGIARRPDNQAFVRTLVSLAKTFNLEVVAEWVGSKDESVLLRALGVDRFQGAYYGMPDMTPPWSRLAPAA